jgi:hypothetical protein
LFDADRQTDKKLFVVFRNFAKAPKNTTTVYYIRYIHVDLRTHSSTHVPSFEVSLANKHHNRLNSFPQEKRKIGTVQTIKFLIAYFPRSSVSFFRSHSLRKEHRLRVFENRVLWKISGPKRDEVKREWRRVHNEELYDLYSSPILFELSNQE